MRHLVKGRKLSRTSSHRKATMQALSCALIKHKMIKTTVTKAKELRRYVEPIITKSKNDTVHNRRQAFSSLQDKEAVSILFDEIAPEVADRPGGYTRVLKLGFRLGDSTDMALIELVDFSDYEPEERATKKKRTRRAGKSNKPTTSEPQSEQKEDKKVEADTDKEETQKTVEDNTDDKISAQVSTDMTAKEAIAHIKDTPIEELEGFVTEDEERVTVNDAWESKKAE